jgi:hypothetical protein
MPSRNIKKKLVRKSRIHNNRNYLQIGGKTIIITSAETGQRITINNVSHSNPIQNIYDLKKHIFIHMHIPLDNRFNIILRKGALECLDTFDLTLLFRESEEEINLVMSIRTMNEMQQLEKATNLLNLENRQYLRIRDTSVHKSIVKDMLVEYSIEIIELKKAIENIVNTDVLPQLRQRPNDFPIEVVPQSNSRIPLRLLPTDRIDDIKKAITHSRGIPFGQIKLIYQGAQLEDGRTISEYNIVANSQIFLTLRLGGGCSCLDFLCESCARNNIEREIFHAREDTLIRDFPRDVISRQHEIIHLRRVLNLLQPRDPVSAPVSERERQEQMDRELAWTLFREDL